jgi:hypothetical protein
MESIEIVSTGPEPLQTNRCKAILVLRLGAALNSLRAAQRWTLKEHGDSPAGQMDMFQTYLVAGAYLAEACKLFWANQGCIVVLARKGSGDEGKIASLFTVADPKTGMQANLLKCIRDKETFHWDSDIFERWASAQKDKVVWQRCSGGTVGECVMWASHEAVSEFTASLNIEKGRSLQDRINDQLLQVLDAMKVVIHIFESAVYGFLEEHGATHGRE